MITEAAEMQARARVIRTKGMSWDNLFDSGQEAMRQGRPTEAEHMFRAAVERDQEIAPADAERALRLHWLPLREGRS